MAGFGPIASHIYALFTRNPSAARAVVDLAGLTAGDRVLDIGCGAGGAVDLAAQRIGADRVAAIDPSATFVTMVRKRVPGADIRVGVAEELPFDHGSFTVIFSIASMHHWDDRSRALRSIAAALAPGGRLLIAERALTAPGHGITPAQADALLAELEGMGLIHASAHDHPTGRRRMTAITATRAAG